MDQATASTSHNAPRAYLFGFDIPADHKMPDLALVRNQAAKVTELMRAPIPPQVFVQNNRGEAIGPLPPALWYNSRLPELFQFSYLCSVEDVPEDILPQCIWSLEWMIRAFLEASDEQLKIFAHLAPQGQGHGISTETERYLTLQNIRSKLAEHFLKPQINQPLEALRHIRCSMEADKERSGKSDIFDVNPGLYVSFAVCLARAGTDDTEAKEALSRIIHGTTSESGFGTMAHCVEAKVYLARVLRRLGEDDEAHKLEIWLVRWFKKHPYELSDTVLVHMFTTGIEPATDPVFTDLGGSEWLDHRKATLKTVIRQSKNCRSCGAREPKVKLTQCSQCHHIFYCSKECQRMNWPYHKYIFHYICFIKVLMTYLKYRVSCREAAAYFKRTAEVERTNAFAGQRFRDWMNYRRNPRSETLESFAHALGLARDASRGRTHIVYQDVKYVPSVQNLLDKFRTTGVGVFKLEDVWQDLEFRMGLDPGEGKVYICEMLEEFEPGKGRAGEPYIPIFSLMFSATNDVEVYLRIDSISRSTVASMRPNPDWRCDVNVKGEPPVHIKLGDGKILDAEFNF
ncbi:uncharacterized protein BT62DRAFT_975945 [Guyanagaster necrorhizus]|uniref:MYND-type domain-containing protein n=1 Tax=Guyanagaster necrorhizus TaxID=856835 RepID=A0A9P8AM59_9AGAR|nr:uncharacterized protein BT62DRAFT_975945 [Guyanagaster necrorhizus MCA 3950]KAG7440389.1 hypothetical protein BT62DRAFT_975945 [Guyanagaster necrorhizus MCA 3950]